MITNSEGVPSHAPFANDRAQNARNCLLQSSNIWNLSAPDMITVSLKHGNRTNNTQQRSGYQQ